MLKRIVSVFCAAVLLSASALCLADGTYGDNTTEGKDNLTETVDYLSLVNDSSLYFEGDYICGISAGTTVDELKNQFFNKQNITVSAVKTGATVTYKGTKGNDTATIVVEGDVSGDGKVTVTDITAAWNSISAQAKLSDAAFKAADMDNSGTLNVVDIACIRKAIV